MTPFSHVAVGRRHERSAGVTRSWGASINDVHNFLHFLTPSPLSAFGADLCYKIHATSLVTSAFPWPPSNADIISGVPLVDQTSTQDYWQHACTTISLIKISEFLRQAVRHVHLDDRNNLGTFYQHIEYNGALRGEHILSSLKEVVGKKLGRP